MATTAEQILRAELHHRGAMPWSEVMQLALYHPEAGYYRYPRRIGRGGDFYTAVTVGPLYGRLLAELAQHTWQRCGCPAEFWLIEQGAHDGQLAEDIWLALQHQPISTSLRYCIIEERPSYLQALSQRLTPLLGQQLHLCPQASARDYGLVLWNELADALPCERCRWDGSQWLQLGIQLCPAAELCWAELGPLHLPQLPTHLPVGYTTEVNLHMAQVASQAAALLQHGAFYIADYGYTAEEYYHIDRPTGTLRRYHQHKTDDQLLSALGEADLTAHIDFTALISTLEEQGWNTAEFLDQGRFLTRLAEPWLRSLDGHRPTAESMALLRQFQTLTHPSHMGSSFRCLLMQR